MKLITVIINEADASEFLGTLSTKGFHSTSMESYGDYLKMKNRTVLIGVEDDRVDEVLEIVQAKASKRFKLTTQKQAANTNQALQTNFGGATVFVTAVDRFEKY